MSKLTPAELQDGMAALREVEVAWLSAELSEAIANLGYPVGCGIAPHPEQIKRAAEKLFARYERMIAMAASGRDEGDAALERAAADLWRKENPDKSVFACDAIEKERYRERVRDAI